MFPLRLPRCRVASDLGCAVSRRVAVAIDLEGMQPQSRPPYRSLWQWDGGAGGVLYPTLSTEGTVFGGFLPFGSGTFLRSAPALRPLAQRLLRIIL